MKSKLFILSAFAVFLHNCTPDMEPKIQSAIQERVQKYKKEKIAECHKAILKIAEQKVDSALLAEALADGVDTLMLLQRLRPEKPEALETFDILEIKPIFEQN